MGDEFGERQHAPTVAPRAIGGDLVAVLEQAGFVVGRQPRLLEVALDQAMTLQHLADA